MYADLDFDKGDEEVQVKSPPKYEDYQNKNSGAPRTRKTQGGP